MAKNPEEAYSFLLYGETCRGVGKGLHSPAPEKNISLLAHDFPRLLCCWYASCYQRVTADYQSTRLRLILIERGRLCK